MAAYIGDRKVNSTEFGKWLWYERSTRKLSGAQFALKVNLSVATIYALELGKRMPRVETVQKIMNALYPGDSKKKRKVMKMAGYK